MAVPSSVLERVKKLENVRKRVDERRFADAVDRGRRAAVAAERAGNRQLLTELAVEIFSWRDAVTKSRDAQRIWNLIGSGTRVPIFADWFWDGLPIQPRNPLDAQTRIFLDGPNHHFLVEEWRNDGLRGEIRRYRETCRLKSPLEMVDQLHPRLLAGLQTHLSGPEAWQTIIDELDSWLDRYMTAAP